MKNRFLLSLTIASLLGLGAVAQENYDLHVYKGDNTSSYINKAPNALQSNEYVIKSCGDDIYGLGGISQKVSIKIMNKVLKENAMILSGNEITRINYGLGSGENNITGISNVRVFVTEDPEGNDVVSQTIDDANSTTKGWHEVVLDTPYKITDKEFYIGYEAELDAGYYGIGTGDGNYELTTFYIYDDVSKKWYLQTWTSNYGIASIYAVAEGDVVPDKSSLSVSLVSSPIYVKSGEETAVAFKVTNTGFDKVSNVDVTYSFNGEEETQEVQLDLSQGSNKTITMRHTFTVESGVESKEIEIKVTPKEKEDIDMSDNVLKVYANIYADGASLSGERKVLFEQFTTENCGNCPTGDQIITNALAKYTNGEVIRMSHHSGYYADKLTIEYGEVMSSYFYNDNGSYAPACMIDRKFRENYPGYSGSAPGPVFSVSQDYIRNAVDGDLAMPLFATVNLNTEYNESTRELNINVSGKCALKLANPYLNIIMTEDGINGNQSGAAGTWTHYHAVRASLTDLTGVPVTFDSDGNYSYQTTYKIPTSITGVKNISVAVNSEKINIVAFLCEMPLDNPVACEVLNAAIAEKPASTTSIKDINGNNFAVYVEDGYLVVDGEFDSAQLYNVNGSLVKNINENVTSVSDLDNGVYLVKLNVNGKSSVNKVFVNK